jgi:hypothetical protein
MRRRPVRATSSSTVAASSPLTAVTLNTEPADARTHFGAKGSTEPEVNTTAPNPAPSALRRRVPALPGSARRTHTSTGAPAGTSVSVASGSRAIAATPCDVTASVTVASVPFSTRIGSSPAGTCEPGSAKTSRSSTPAATASATSVGPSMT